MKKLPLLFAAFLVVSASGLRAGEPSDIHTLLRRLDGLLDRREEFLLRHEARLDSLKSLLRGDTLGFGARYAVTAEIAERYFAYQSDSTIAYLRRNVALAERAGNADLTIRAKSVMAMCYSMNGRFLEADRVLAGATDTLHMSRATQAAYYAAQHRQNRECRSQSEPGAERDRFRACEEYYARRALETTGDISKRFYFAYLVAVDEGDYDRAAAACDSALACAPPVSHDYARAAFYRSETERFRGDEAARFEWLVRAAMAECRGGPRLRRLGRRGRRAAAPGRRRTGDAVYPRCDQRHAGLQFAHPFVARHGDSAPDRAGVQRAQCPSARDVRRADPSGLSFRPLGNRRRAVRPAPEPAAQRRAADPARVERETGRAGCQPARNQCRPEPAEHPHRRRQPHQGGLYRRVPEDDLRIYLQTGRHLPSCRPDAARRPFRRTAPRVRRNRCPERRTERVLPQFRHHLPGAFPLVHRGSSTACSPTMRASGSAVREASRPNCASSRWSGWASPTRRPSPHCCTVRSIRCTATVRACGCVRSFRSGISNSGCSPSVSGTMPRSFPGPDRNGASCRRNTEFFRSGCTLRRGNAYICSTHIPIR